MRALALAALGGCSFIGVRSLPDHPTQVDITTCADTRVAPTIDTIYGSAYGFAAIAAGIAATQPYTPRGRFEVPPGAIAIVAAVLATPFALSAWHGWSATGECRDARQHQHDAQLARVPILERAMRDANDALASARMGDCAKVAAAVEQLRAVASPDDRVDLAKAFAAEPAIAICAQSDRRAASYCFAVVDATRACWSTEADCRAAVAEAGLAGSATCTPASGSP